MEREQGGILPFEHLLMEMEQSMFCLVLPDMGLSARLLSEVMLAGMHRPGRQPQIATL